MTKLKKMVAPHFSKFSMFRPGKRAGTGRHNFENYENGGGTTIFKVVKVPLVGSGGGDPAPSATLVALAMPW